MEFTGESKTYLLLLHRLAWFDRVSNDAGWHIVTDALKHFTVSDLMRIANALPRAKLSYLVL